MCWGLEWVVNLSALYFNSVKAALVVAAKKWLGSFSFILHFLSIWGVASGTMQQMISEAIIDSLCFGRLLPYIYTLKHTNE